MEQAARDTRLLLRHVQELGFVVNEKKNHLSPSQDVVFVGMALDSSLMRATLLAKGVETVLSFLHRFRLGWTVSVRDCQRLLGLLWQPRRWSPWASFISGRCSVGSTPTGCIHGDADTVVSW